MKQKKNRENLCDLSTGKINSFQVDKSLVGIEIQSIDWTVLQVQRFETKNQSIDLPLLSISNFPSLRPNDHTLFPNDSFLSRNDPFFP